MQTLGQHTMKSLCYISVDELCSSGQPCTHSTGKQPMLLHALLYIYFHLVDDIDGCYLLTKNFILALYDSKVPGLDILVRSQCKFTELDAKITFPNFV